MKIGPAPLSLCMSLALLTACDRPEPYEDGAYEEKQQAWAAEREAHGPLGREASIDLAGDPIHLTGISELSVDDVTLRAAAEAAPYLFLLGAVTAAGSGTVILEGATIEVAGASSATVTGIELSADAVLVQAAGGAVADAMPELPSGWEDAAAAWRHQSELRFEGATLTGFTRAVLLHDDDTSELDDLSDVTAQAVVWADGGRLATGPIDLTYERFALGGDVTGGSWTLDGAEQSGALPSGVFGTAATLSLEPARAASVGTFRLTQAIVEDGDDDLLLDSEVEVFGPTSEVTVVAGEKSLIPVLYREKSYLGDGVLDTIEVEGSGAEHVELNITWPDALLFDLVERIDASVEGVAIALLVGVSAPALLLVTAVECIFEGCPVPDKYPLWMYAGDSSRFEVLVKDDTPAGAYDLTVRFFGRNYEPAEVSFSFRVEAP